MGLEYEEPDHYVWVKQDNGQLIKARELRTVGGLMEVHYEARDEKVWVHVDKIKRWQ